MKKNCHSLSSFQHHFFVHPSIYSIFIIYKTNLVHFSIDSSTFSFYLLCWRYVFFSFAFIYSLIFFKLSDFLFGSSFFFFKLGKMYKTCLLEFVDSFDLLILSDGGMAFFVVVILFLYPNYFYSNKFLFVYKVIKENSLNEKRDERHLASFGSTIHIYQIHPSITVIIHFFWNFPLLLLQLRVYLFFVLIFFSLVVHYCGAGWLLFFCHYFISFYNKIASIYARIFLSVDVGVEWMRMTLDVWMFLSKILIKKGKGTRSNAKWMTIN